MQLVVLEGLKGLGTIAQAINTTTNVNEIVRLADFGSLQGIGTLSGDIDDEQYLQYFIDTRNQIARNRETINAFIAPDKAIELYDNIINNFYTPERDNIIEQTIAQLEAMAMYGEYFIEDFNPNNNLIGLGEIERKRWLHIMNRVNPVLVAARAAYLILLRVNFRGHSTIFANAKASGIVSADGTTPNSLYANTLNRWYNFGGDGDPFINGFKAGYDKKPLFGQKELEGLGQLGVLSESTIVTASIIIKAIAALLGAAIPIILAKMDNDYNMELLEKGLTPPSPLTIPGFQWTPQGTLAPSGGAASAAPSDNPELDALKDPKNIAIIAAIVVGVLILIFSSTKKTKTKN